MASAATFDPQVQQIATVYARGFLQAAMAELQHPAAVQSAVEELVALTDEVLVKNPKFLARLSSSRGGGSDPQGLLRRTLGAKVSGVIVRFLGVVCQHGRMGLIAAITRRIQDLANEASGVVPVEITSAIPMPAEVEARVVERLEAVMGSKIRLTKSVQPELLGGLQVRVGDTVFDGSVQGRLERVRRTAFARTAERIRADFDRFVAVQ